GVSDQEADSKLGEGPQIILYDASMVSHKGVRELVIQTADEFSIPFQYATMAGGGTDSGSIHLTANGVPALSTTVATRYIHSHAAILHRDDFENAVKLIVETIKKLDHDKVNDIRLAYSGCSKCLKKGIERVRFRVITDIVYVEHEVITALTTLYDHFIKVKKSQIKYLRLFLS